MKSNVRNHTSVFVGMLISILFLLVGCTPGANHVVQVGGVARTPAVAHPTPMLQGIAFSVPPLPTVTPTPTPSTASGSTALESQIAQAVFQAINQSRASAGLPALRWSVALVRSAHQHNLAMEAAQQLSHQLPGEPRLGTRESQQGVNWSWAGENIGVTSDLSVEGALGLHQAMMAEQPPNDGHRQIILTTSGNILGVEILMDFSHQRLWLTEDFAQV